MSSHVRAAVASGALTLVLQLPSLQPIFKFFPAPALIAGGVFLVCFVFCWLVLHPPSVVDRWLTRSLLTRTVLGACVVIPLGFWLSIEAPGLGASDADVDDAMILPVQALLQGEGLFGVPLHTGNPVSPGPGWLLLNAPFSFAGYPLYIAFLPFYLGAMAYSLRRSFGDWRTTNRVLTLLASSVLFWKLLVSGNDLVAVGCVLLVLFLWLERLPAPRMLHPATCLFALAVGLVSTSRIPFVGLPILFAAFLWSRRRADAVFVGVAGVVVAATFHVGFWQRPYPPLHLLAKAESVLAWWAWPVAVLLLSGLLVPISRGITSFAGRLGAFCIGILVPLVSVAVGELWTAHFILAAWDAAAYLSCGMPAMILFLLVWQDGADGQVSGDVGT